MRLTEFLTLPSELERARKAGELIVFAGAGVSMGPPARLPDFVGLATQIAEPKLPFRRADAKSLDRYLGRALREGVDVQQRAREILDVRGSHTPLHEYLLGIFGAAERVRLITTNFDRYFADAAAVVFPNGAIPQYVGPALPPGQHFRGIAQLHGSLDREESALVLTDRDFADAYMAEGWAARFLVRAFADRTVLFVGYSLGDPIMRYLLHALPPTGRWFALWRDKEVGQGSEHAITPVTYGKKRSRAPYKDLNEGMKRWYWYARASPTDHDRKIRRLIVLGPPASPLDADYLRARLTSHEGRAVFWTTATQERWFAWAASEGFLDGLVDPRAEASTVAGWSRWCLDHFCNSESPPLLRHLRGRAPAVNVAFREQLILHLWRMERLPPRPVLRQLIALVVGQSTDPVGDSDAWAWLLGRMVSDECHEEALALLRAGTHLGLQPLERIYLAYEAEGDEPGDLPPLATRVATRVAASSLVELLAKHGSTLVAGASLPLLWLGEQRIEEAYQLLELGRGTTDGIDGLSFARTSIAPSGQDSFAHAEDVLVEIVRLALDHFAAAESLGLQAFAARYDTSARALLRRLALYALAKCTSCSSDDVLARALALRWYSDLWLRPELYMLLGTHFPRASEPARRAFVDVLRDDARWGDEFGRSDAHTRFSLSVKLLRDAPDSEAAKDFATAESKAHPDWLESDPDGFLSRVEVGWGRYEPSPIEAEQLLERTPEEALAELRAALPSLAGRGQEMALLGAVQHAAGSRADWGIDLFVLAMAGDEVATRIAEAALFGLRDATLDPPLQLMLLERVRTGRWVQELTRTIASVLDQWTRRFGKMVPPEVLDAFDAVADLLFERSRSVAPGIVDSGWTERAINHPAGHAAEVWWQVANTRDWVDGRYVLTLDDAEKSRWLRVLSDDTAAGAFARPILGMAIDRLTVGDFPWAAKEVLPAFDPSAGAEKAAQLWDGRLMQSHWYWGTVEGLSESLKPMFEQSATLLPARAEQLGDLVALLVARMAESGITLVQLQAFVQHSTGEARRSFAHALPDKLHALTSDERRRVWNEILARYWADRRTNMPLPLSADELGAMVSWAEALPEVAGELVAALRRSPKIRLEHADHLLWKWTRDDGSSWVRGHSAEAVGVVVFLAERESINSWMADAALDVLDVALLAGAPTQDVLAAAEALVSISPVRAVALVDRLRVAA